ncbi:MAG: hypothetical protein FJ253_06155 [Phycisphaerae bacterium]|nr:hypothetical protein [Phycisphaerae bacterium]
MSREELVELSILEAAGLLDEVDSTLLNRLFHAAPPALQAEVRALQASIASSPTLLADDEPHAELGARCVMRIKDEMAADHAALAPIATIGPRRPVPVSAADQVIELVELRASNHAMRTDALRWSRAAVMWRAASVVIGALLLVSLYYNLASNLYSVRIGQLALDANAREELARVLGTSYREFAEGGCLVRGMSAAQVGFSGAATAYVNRRTGEALVVAFGLPEEIPYTVRIVADNGQATDVGLLRASNHTTLLRITNADGFQLAFGRLEIVDPSGAVILHS